MCSVPFFIIFVDLFVVCGLTMHDYVSSGFVFFISSSFVPFGRAKQTCLLCSSLLKFKIEPLNSKMQEALKQADDVFTKLVENSNYRTVITNML